MATVISSLDVARGALSQAEAAALALGNIDLASLPSEDLPGDIVDARAGLEQVLTRLRQVTQGLQVAKERQRPPAPQGCVYLDEWVRAWRVWEQNGGEDQPQWRENMPAARFLQAGAWPADDALDPNDHNFFWVVRLWDVNETTAYARIDTAVFDDFDDDFAGDTSFWREDELVRTYANCYGRGV